MSVYIKSEENENGANGNRTYIVTAKFKISGFLPDMVTEEHIIHNLKAAIQDAVNEIPLSSEYYQNYEEDEEWAVYLEDNIKIEMEQMSVRICSDPFCEHCGERYTDFGVEIFYDGTSWCLDCYLSGSNREYLSEEDIKEIQKKLKELKKKHLLKQLHELENDDE